MFIKRINLKNIRSYHDESIIFPRSSVMLSGDIGSGKSSILLAIEFALFGINKSAFTGETLLSAGKNEGSVELEFEIIISGINKNVIIYRCLKKLSKGINQGNGYIIIDGQKTDATPTELKSIVLDLLGYPMDLLSKNKDLIYRYTVFTPQEMMKQIIFEDKSVRLNILRKVFDVDKYNTILENSSFLQIFLRQNSKELSSKSYDLDEKEKLRISYYENRTMIDPEIENVTNEIEKYKQILNKAKYDLTVIEKDMIKFNDIKNKVNLIDEKIKSEKRSHERNIKEIERLTFQNEQLSSKKKTLKMHQISIEYDVDEKLLSTDKNINEISSEKSRLEEKFVSINGLLNDKKSMVENFNPMELSATMKRIEHLKSVIIAKKEFESKLEKLHDQYELIKSDIEKHDFMIENSSKILLNVSKIDKCPTCHQKVEDKYKNELNESQGKIIIQAKNHKTKLEIEFKDIRKNIIEIKKEIEDMNKTEKELIRFEEKAKSLREKQGLIDTEVKLMERLKKEILMIKNELQKLPDIESLMRLKNKLRNEQKLLQENKVMQNDIINIDKNIIDNEKRIMSLNIEVSESNENVIKLNKDKSFLSQELSKLNQVDDLYKKKNVEIDEKRDKISEYVRRLDKLNIEKKNFQIHIDALTKEIDEKILFKKKSIEYNNYEEWISRFFVKLISNIEKHVLLRVYSEFNDLFMQWFNLIIDDETINARLDEEFSPIIEVNGYEIGVENLSGGEKTAVALSYRLALNKIINELLTSVNTKDLIILDEPTDGFSTDQLDKMRLVLDELGMKQVIIVSHETKIESFVDHVIKIQKIENISQVV